MVRAGATRKTVVCTTTEPARPRRERRCPTFPTAVPSELARWLAVVAPAKTPEDILNKLNAEVVKAVTGADARARLQDMGFKVTGTTRAEFAAVIRDDTARWGKAVAATGFKAD